jgi:hypothetical protein
MFGCASVASEKQKKLTLKSEVGDEAIENASSEAKKLLNSMELNIVLEQAMEKMLDVQLQQNPTLVPYKKVMLKFISKHMSFENLEPQMIKMYADAFTAQELRDINAFYQTPTGKKTIKVIPELMSKGAQIGMERVQENAAELQLMMKEESERLLKLQED